MKILIAYGTGEGQTRKIAKFISNRLREAGHDIVLHDTEGLLGDRKVADFDRVILAGSIHEYGHQKSLEAFVVAHRDELDALPTLFLSVSLSAAFEDKLADAEGYVETFVKNTKWQPGEVQLVAGALHYGEYGYYKEAILEHQVLRDKSVENPGEDQEYTDWDELGRVVDEFMAA